MHRLLEQVEKEIRERTLFRDGDAIVVAVSGGLDSMVLLHILNRLSVERSWKLTVAHYNHQLRGKESDRDEALVCQAARELQLPFFSGTANVKAYAKSSGLSVEMAARQLRHEFLSATAKKVQAGKIAMAHHANDQVELFFLRLFRGSGPQGLAGMRWISPSPWDRKLKCVRPLLGSEKSILLDYAESEKIVFGEDATNKQVQIPRNRVRHDLLPRLEKDYQPALTSTILRVMELIRDEDDFVSKIAQEACQNASFDEMPVALQRRHIQAQLYELKLPVDFDLVEELRKNPESQVSVSDQIGVFRDRAGKICASKPIKASFNVQQLPISLDLRSQPQEIEFQGLKLSVLATHEPQNSFEKRPNFEIFDADKVGTPILLRHWRPGDRFQPIGTKKAAKLQDLFINLKVSQTERHKRIIAVSQSGQIFWVEGMRISECFKLDKQTVRWLNWGWKR